MDEIQKNLLEQVAGLHEIPEGAYNIRVLMGDDNQGIFAGGMHFLKHLDQIVKAPQIDAGNSLPPEEFCSTERTLRTKTSPSGQSWASASPFSSRSGSRASR